MRNRISNLIRRLAVGEDFYISDTPRITYAEIDEIEKLGGYLQVESIHGAETRSPRLVYPIDEESFRRLAEELGDDVT